MLARGYIDPDQDAYVVVDDRMVSYMSVKYLSSYDGNKIFFINSMERLPSAQNRLLGYRQALADYGIKAVSYTHLPRRSARMSARLFGKNQTAPIKSVTFHSSMRLF